MRTRLLAAIRDPYTARRTRLGHAAHPRVRRCCVGAASVLRRCCGSGRDAVHARATALSGTAVRRGGRAEASDSVTVSFCGPAGSTPQYQLYPTVPTLP